MSKVQTENSYFEDKIALRLGNLPKKNEILVLDCFAGRGRIWKEISRRSKKDISVISIEKKSKDGIFLKGDNLKFLGAMDLSLYDVIDLDAYGVPYRQLKLVFASETLKKKTMVFVTFIQSMYGGIPKRLLNDIGYSRNMIKKIPTLFYKDGYQKFKEFLGKNGVRKIRIRNEGKKHYLCFEI